MPAKHNHTHVVSSTPGRTRLRVSQKRRNKKEMGRIVDALEERLGVAETRTNVQTGSILLHHPRGTLEAISSVLQDLGVILDTVTNMDISSVGGKTKVASGVVDALSELNQRIGLATNGLVNLRVFLPLGFGTLALLQLARRGLQIEALPWYVLAYAAFDSFVKLHRTTETGQVK